MNSLTLLVRDASPTLRLLVINQFGINLGFYMLMPYLAAHLSVHIGLSAWLVGLILGIRNLSQQGLFALGGALADRVGYRTMIIAGCGLRTASFALLAFATSVPALVIASIGTGLAGALFNPAVRAYVAAESPDRPAEGFALFNIGYQGGILAGPLAGLALTAVDFRLTAACAAVVFATLTVAQLRRLPEHRPATDPDCPQRILRQWATVVGNRAFRRFAVVMAVSYVLSFQTCLAIPLGFGQALGDGEATVATSVTFAVCGLVAVAAQAGIQRWCATLPQGRALTAGMLVMAAAFLPSALTVTMTSSVYVVALGFSALLLTVGTLVAYPYEMQTVVRLAENRLVATHYGVYQTVAGIAIAIGMAGTGRAIDTTPAAPATTWWLLAMVGVACAMLLWRMESSAPAPPPVETAGPTQTRDRRTGLLPR